MSGFSSLKEELDKSDAGLNHTYRSELGDLADPSQFQNPIDITGESGESLMSWLERMLVIRRAEEAIARLVDDGHAKTPCHLGIGQEAVAVGMCAQLTTEDRVFGTHRSHSQFLAMGCSIDSLIAEVLGKITGCSKGMGGSMHLTSVEHGFWGSVPIVGATIPIAVGAGLAAKKDGSDAVAVCFFGDGAAEEGSVHESLNLARVYDVPVIFVCENNFYASHMDIKLRQASDRVARFADAHNIPAEVVDGNDVVAVRKAAGRLVDHARAGGGPGFLEAVTYRWRGHVGPREDIDVGVRRRPEDLEAWKQRDPIARLLKAMGAAGILSTDDFVEMERFISSQVQEACEKAQAAPYPEAAALHDLVFAESEK